jgi:carboxypeptidase family protein
MAPRITVVVFLVMVACGCGGQTPAAPVAPTAVPPTTPGSTPTRMLQPLHIAGRVIDGAGNPVPGARVTQWDTANTTMSDGSGAFEMTASITAQDRSFWVTVEKPGFETSELNRTVDTATTTLLRLHQIRTIDVGESLHSVINFDDSGCGYHWGYLCRRARLTPSVSGTLTLEVVPESGGAIGMLVGPGGFPQQMQRRVTTSVKAGSEVVVEVATEWSPGASVGFTLNTSLTSAN